MSEKNGGPNMVQAWREFRGLSRELLAERLDTSPQMIWALEVGERGLTAKWLRRIAKALNTTPGHLLDGDPRKLPTNVIDIWHAIPDDQREQAERVFEAFARRDRA